MSDPVLDCGDSPLSITSNVIGIFTFVLALVASILAFITVFRDAEGEIAYYEKTMGNIGVQIDQLRQSWKDLDRDASLSPPTDSSPYIMRLLDAMNHSLGGLSRAYDIVQGDLREASAKIPSKFSMREWAFRWRMAWVWFAWLRLAWLRLVGRLEWWHREKEIASRVGRLESQKAQFISMLLILLFR